MRMPHNNRLESAARKTRTDQPEALNRITVLSNSEEVISPNYEEKTSFVEPEDSKPTSAQISLPPKPTLIGADLPIK